VAAIEFGFFAIVLAAALANVTDVSIYIYQRMQAENATQIAAQAAWKACDLSKLPAIVNCQPALTTAMQSALTSTSLGTRVSLMPGSPSEGYYCVNSSNALQYVGDVYSKPADCTAAGMPSLQPGDYIQVQTTFTYTSSVANPISLSNPFSGSATTTRATRCWSSTGDRSRRCADSSARWAASRWTPRGSSRAVR
jgi:Flp pilus assembly protein TadG